MTKTLKDIPADKIVRIYDPIRRRKAHHLRNANDEYPTPYSITHLLIQTGFLDPLAPTLEPHCGRALAMVAELETSGFERMDCYDIQFGRNFLDERRRFSQIVMNPPYRAHLDHLMKAKEVASERFCALLPLNYLSASTRMKSLWLDREFPVSRVYALTRGIDFTKPLRDDGRHFSGMMTFGWFCWDRAHHGQPELHWLFAVRGFAQQCVTKSCVKQPKGTRMPDKLIDKPPMPKPLPEPERKAPLPTAPQPKPIPPLLPPKNPILTE